MGGNGGAGSGSGKGGDGGTGGDGVYLKAGGTVTNAGTISHGDGGVSGSGGANGTGGDAVYFGKGASRLIIDPGAVFSGKVVFDSSFSNAIELAKGTGAIGTIAGIGGATFTGFDALTVDSGATWDLSGTPTLASSIIVTNDGTISEAGSDQLTLDGSLTGSGTIKLDPTTLTLNGYVGTGQTIDFTATGDTLKLGDVSTVENNFHGTIEGFAQGDAIDLTGLSSGSITGHSFANGVLTIDLTSGGPITLDFSNPSNFSGQYFDFTADTGTGTDITYATCYCPGTLILTPAGEVAVEDLAIGDWVITHSG